MRVSQMMKALIPFVTAAALGCGILVTPPAANASAWQGKILSDSVASWWSRPNAAYQPLHEITYTTGVSSAGDWIWGAYDHKTGVTTRRVLGRMRQDDHNTPAILAPTDRPPVVFYTGHNTSSVIWTRRSRKVGDWLPGPERALPMPGDVTYVQVHRGHTPDTLLLLTRCGRHWLLAVSEDYGDSWTLRRLASFDSEAYAYLTTAQRPDGTIRIAVAGHPDRSVLTTISYAEIDPIGDVRSADGTLVANVYTGEGLPLTPEHGLTPIYEYAQDMRARLFEVSSAASPEIVLAEWVGDEEARYVYLRREGDSWESTMLAPAGRPIGFSYATRYLGGATFSRSDEGGDLYLSREASGTWSIEHWTLESGAWTSSVVATSTRTLARPTVPLDASPQLPLLWLNLTAYRSYTDFAGSTYGLLPEGKPGPAAVGTPICGDWDGDGKVEPGVFYRGAWTLATSAGPVKFRFGRRGDKPIVGDWDGDDKDDIGLVRGREWILSSAATSGTVLSRFWFGKTGDKPVVGDWDGDGADGIGVRRRAEWFLKERATDAVSTYRFRCGVASDVPVAGDWNGDGKDEVGVKRGSEWKLRRDLGTASYRSYTFGNSTDVPVVGDWGAFGKDSPGVRRMSNGVWYFVDTASGVPEPDVAPNRLLF